MPTPEEIARSVRKLANDEATQLLGTSNGGSRFVNVILDQPYRGSKSITAIAGIGCDKPGRVICWKTDDGWVATGVEAQKGQERVVRLRHNLPSQQTKTAGIVKALYKLRELNYPNFVDSYYIGGDREYPELITQISGSLETGGGVSTIRLTNLGAQQDDWRVDMGVVTNPFSPFAHELRSYFADSSQNIVVSNTGALLALPIGSGFFAGAYDAGTYASYEGVNYFKAGNFFYVLPPNKDRPYPGTITSPSINIVGFVVSVDGTKSIFGVGTEEYGAQVYIYEGTSSTLVDSASQAAFSGASRRSSLIGNQFYKVIYDESQTPLQEVEQELEVKSYEISGSVITETGSTTQLVYPGGDSAIEVIDLIYNPG